MTCRVCFGQNLVPLPFPVPTGMGTWRRCRGCKSDTNLCDYPAGLYTQAYEADEVRESGGHDERVEQLRSNLDWFGHHSDGLPNKDFLDVGCCEGLALTGMQDRGWSVHGFEVFRPSYMGPHVTVAPVFHRWLFPRRYSAILCREVLEHVPHPDLLLHELHGASEPGGLVQVQTPRPTDEYNWIPYQGSHLQLIDPDRLRSMFSSAMFEVIEARVWEIGQAYLLRARK